VADTGESHSDFLILDNGALYEFPNKGCFRGFCKARARGDTSAPVITDKDLAGLPSDVDKEQVRELWSRPRPVTPTDFSAVFRGRAWDMSGGSLEPGDWKNLDDLLEHA